MNVPFGFINRDSQQERRLRWFVQVAECLNDGFDSLRSVHRELSRRGGDNCPSLTTVMQIDDLVDGSFSCEFGRPIRPFKRTNDKRVIGLTADGIEALRRANEYFESLKLVA